MEKYFRLNDDFLSFEKIISIFNVKIKGIDYSGFNHSVLFVNNLIQITSFSSVDTRYNIICVNSLKNSYYNKLDLRFIISSVKRKEDFLILNEIIKKYFDFKKFETINLEDSIKFLEEYKNEIIELCQNKKLINKSYYVIQDVIKKYNIFMP